MASFPFLSPEGAAHVQLFYRACVSPFCHVKITLRGFASDNEEKHLTQARPAGTKKE